jgi:hypothetical protein
VPVTDHYLGLVERSRKLVGDMAADHDALLAFTRSHNFSADFELLRDAIGARPEARVFTLAIREYQFALYALVAGTYRHAFISLRLFFELSLATIYFSASEFKYRQWLGNAADIIWAALLDQNNGVYAVAFISAFNPELSSDGKQYSALADKVYRECSEHVHGNIHTHPENDAPLVFSREKVLAWNSLAESVRLCIVFAYAARFLKLMPQEDRNKLEAPILESLGTLAPIQALFNR